MLFDLLLYVYVLMQSDLHLVLNTYESTLIVHDDDKKVLF